MRSRPVPVGTGTSPCAVWLRGLRLRRHAGTRSPAAERARARDVSHGAEGGQAIGGPQAGSTQAVTSGRRAITNFNVLTEAKRIEKLRYMHRNPGETWIGRAAGRMEVEQLSSLPDRRRRDRSQIEPPWTARKPDGTGLRLQLRVTTVNRPAGCPSPSFNRVPRSSLGCPVQAKLERVRSVDSTT